MVARSAGANFAAPLYYAAETGLEQCLAVNYLAPSYCSTLSTWIAFIFLILVAFPIILFFPVTPFSLPTILVLLFPF